MDNIQQSAATDPLGIAVSIGALIRRKREEKGLSLVDLAARTTVSSPQYLSTLEAGRVNVARSKHLSSIAAALDLTAEEQSLILGIQHHQSNKDERLAVDVFSPVDAPEFNLLVLSGETLLPCRVADEIVIVDYAQGELGEGRTYLVDLDAWALAVCVADQDGKLSLLVGKRIYALERITLLGRVLHRGRNL